MNVKVTYKDPWDAVKVLVEKNVADARSAEGMLRISNEAGTVAYSIPIHRVLFVEAVDE